MSTPSVEGQATRVGAQTETVIRGKIVAGDGRPVGGAFVGLLDGTGELTVEVVASSAGNYRFFASPGEWTVRAISPVGNGAASVQPESNGIYEVNIAIDA